MKSRIFLSLLTAAALLLTASASHATKIHGAILFSSFSWSKDGTTVSVVGPSIIASTEDMTGQTGVVINDLDYSPFSALDPLWETDDYSFAITSLTIISETATGLELDGTGIVSDKNAILEDTLGAWTFSGGTINWSSATISECSDATGSQEPSSCHSNPIPEPSATLLFGIGALTAGRAVRRS